MCAFLGYSFPLPPGECLFHFSFLSTQGVGGKKGKKYLKITAKLNFKNGFVFDLIS